MRRPSGFPRSRRVRAFTLVEMLIVIGVILILTTIGVGIATAVVRGAESVQMRSAFNVMDAAFGEWESLTGRPVSYCGTGIQPPDGSSSQMFDVWEPGGTPPGAVTPAARIYGAARGAGVYAVNLLIQAESVRGIVAQIPPHLLRSEASGRPLVPTAAQDMYPPVNLSFPAAGGRYTPSSAQVLGVASSANPRPLTSRAEFVDPWGNRVAFVFPGRDFRQGQELPGVAADPDGTVRTGLENLEIGFGVCAESRICLVSAGPDGVFGVEGDAPAALSGPDRSTFLRTAASDNVYLYPLDPPDQP